MKTATLNLDLTANDIANQKIKKSNTTISYLFLGLVLGYMASLIVPLVLSLSAKGDFIKNFTNDPTLLGLWYVTGILFLISLLFTGMNSNEKFLYTFEGVYDTMDVERSLNEIKAYIFFGFAYFSVTVIFAIEIIKFVIISIS